MDLVECVCKEELSQGYHFSNCINFKEELPKLCQCTIYNAKEGHGLWCQSRNGTYRYDDIPLPAEVPTKSLKLKEFNIPLTNKDGSVNMETSEWYEERYMPANVTSFTEVEEYSKFVGDTVITQLEKQISELKEAIKISREYCNDLEQKVQDMALDIDYHVETVTQMLEIINKRVTF